MTKSDPFKGFHSSLEIICLTVMLYVRFPLSLRDVEDLLHERGVEISHETVQLVLSCFRTVLNCSSLTPVAFEVIAHSRMKKNNNIKQYFTR